MQAVEKPVESVYNFPHEASIMALCKPNTKIVYSENPTFCANLPWAFAA